MITKEKFIEVLNFIKKDDKKLQKLDNLYPELASGLAFQLSEYHDYLIELLEQGANCRIDEYYGSAITWWLYDTEYGTNRPYVWVKIKNGKRAKERLVLGTPEKLYDYIMKYEQKK